MTHVERVMSTLSHKQPDKTPVSIGTMIVDGLTRYAKDNNERYKGKPVTEALVTSRAMQIATVPEWILEDLDCEFRPVRMIEAFTDMFIRRMGYGWIRAVLEEIRALF